MRELSRKYREAEESVANDHHQVQYDALFPIFDPEQFRDNPIELMYHKLARSKIVSQQSQYSAAVTELKPNKDERNAIQYVLSLPYKRLNIEHKELLWRFRYSLIDDKRALVKFLRCINWSDASETTQYGLIAEEVNQVFPDIGVRNKDGEIESVQYHVLPVLLLNEMKKLQLTIEDLKKNDTQRDVVIQNLLERMISVEARA